MIQLPPPPKLKLQKPKNPHERLFVDDICQTLEIKCIGYQREVYTPVGFIDVLTDDTLYEAKHWSNIKHAVGQILFYGHYFPRESYIIVVFQKQDKKDSIDYTYIGRCMSIIDSLALPILIKTKEDFML